MAASGLALLVIEEAPLAMVKFSAARARAAEQPLARTLHRDGCGQDRLHLHIPSARAATASDQSPHLTPPSPVGAATNSNA